MDVTELRKGCLRRLAEVVSLVMHRARSSKDRVCLKLFALATGRDLSPKHANLLVKALVLFHYIVRNLKHLNIVKLTFSGRDRDLTLFIGFLKPQLGLEELYFPQRLVFLVNFKVYLPPH